METEISQITSGNLKKYSSNNNNKRQLKKRKKKIERERGESGLKK